MKKYKNNKKSKLLKVGIYLRLSDEDKNKANKETDSESIKNQRNMLLTEIKKRPDFHFEEEYCDEDLSGAGTYRPEFERLIKDCETGKIDVVLCKSQSRFSRDMEIIEKYLHNKFIEWNIRFISLTDNADTNLPGNKKARQINGLVNEWYLEDTSNNIKSAFETKMKQGEFISPFTSYGYEISKLDNNKLIIDQVAAETVKNIFFLYIKGLGFTGIANYLNNKKIPCPSLYKYQKGIKQNVISKRPREQIKWSNNAIKTILTNEIYVGNLIQGKRTTISYKNHKIKKKDKSEWIRKENTHEAIITKDTFNEVQTLIKQRTKPIKKTNQIHTFSGKVFCLECKKNMRKKNSKTHKYLTCSNNNDIYNKCNNKKSIRYDKLETIILENINIKIKKYYDKKLLSKINTQSKDSELTQIINKLNQEKQDIRKKILESKKYLKNLYEDRVNKIITIKQFKELATNYQKNEEIYINKLKDINNKIKFYNKKESNKKIIPSNIIFKKLDNILVQEFIEKIFIGKINKKTNKRTIQIKWNF